MTAPETPQRPSDEQTRPSEEQKRSTGDPTSLSAKQPGAPAAERTERSSLIAAGLILLIAGLGFAFLPRLMLALGAISPFLAAAVGTLFVAAFFLVFWLRARVQRRRDEG